MIKKLKIFYARWIKLGRKIAAFQVRAVFILAYYIIILPMGLIFRIFSPGYRAGWIEVEKKETGLEEASRQF